MLNSTLNHQAFNNFEVIQQFNQQLCIKAPCLYHQPERARIFEMLLCKRDAVQSAKASPSIASVSIHFDPKQLSQEKLFVLLDLILSNIGNTVCNSIQQVKSCLSNSTQTEAVSHFFIKGLKCESCAISLEMTLNRHPEISNAHVDYNSTELIVHGRISSVEIVKLVKNSGFESIAK